MVKDRSFLEDFYSETMTEMAETFFARRRRVEARLEGFAGIVREVRASGVRALRHWATLFTLLVDEESVVDFFKELGVDVSALPGQAAAAGDPWRFTHPFALTFCRRYRRAVRYVYLGVRTATEDYLTGAYGPDPTNPMRKILLPNYSALMELASTINAEVLSVNAGQTPSTVLTYAKSLNPSEVEREAMVGGSGWEDVGKMDREMAFTPIDFNGLGLPELPSIPPLEDVEEQLDALSSAICRLRPEEARRAMNVLRAG